MLSLSCSDAARSTYSFFWLPLPTTTTRQQARSSRARPAPPRTCSGQGNRHDVIQSVDQWTRKR